MNSCNRRLATALVSMFLAVADISGLQQHFFPEPAIPTDPITAILDAFRSHPIVALGEGSRGSEQDAAVRLALVRHPLFPTTVNDVVVEFGNARYQDLMDRFVRGEAVPEDTLAQVWQNTTATSVDFDLPVYEDFFRAVRALNAGRPPAQQVRVLLGDPPIDWDGVRTFEDVRTWIARQDEHALDVIRREVLVKGRRALLVYGDMHFQRRNEQTNYETSDTLVGLLESDGFTNPFTIWTTGRTQIDLGILHPGVVAWPRPSLALLRGTNLGDLDFASYFVSTGRVSLVDGKARPIRRDQRRVLRMEDQFDAVLYQGRAAATTYARLSDARCSDRRYLDMRTARINLAPGREREIGRLKSACAPSR